MRLAQPIASRLPARAARLALAVAASALAGCAGPSRHPDAVSKPEIDLRPGFAQGGDPAVVAVRKILGAEGKLLGYLRVREGPGESRTRGYPKPIVRKPVRVYWVYDKFWKQKGFYTEQGDTFLLLRDGELEPLGIHDVDDAKLILLDIYDRQKIELAMIDPPRTLESEAERERAEREAKAAAAKKAAEGGAEGGAPAPEGGS
jgi:hypothetical protein